MATTPQNEEPGFERGGNELPDQDNGNQDTLEEQPSDGEDAGLEDAQEEAAAERKEGGYQ